VYAFTVNVAAAEVPSGSVTVIFRELGEADGSIENTAVMAIELMTRTLLIVMPGIASIVTPLLKFAPVSVMWIDVPGNPASALIPDSTGCERNPSRMRLLLESAINRFPDPSTATAVG